MLGARATEPDSPRPGRPAYDHASPTEPAPRGSPMKPFEGKVAIVTGAVLAADGGDATRLY
jgi:hypothetical protein